MSYLYDGATPWDRSRLASVKAHSGIAVSVYIVGSPGGMRHANVADVALARSMGLAVLPNWERASDFFRTASLADCKAAGAEALAACRALGIPDDGSIAVAFSFDYEVPSSGYARALDQLRACRDGMAGHYQAIGYAQTGLVEYWVAHGLPGPHWLMGSTWRATSTFTSAEVGSRAVAVVQSHDATGRWLNSLVRGTDVNTITQPSRLAAWWPDGSPYGGTVDPSKLWGYTQAIWNKSKPSAWSLLSNIHYVVHTLQTGQASVARGVADGVARVADVQAKLATLAAQVEALAAKVDQQPTVQPTDIPVTISGTGTAHIGGTQ